MTPYLSILSARARVLLQYRAAALAGFGTQLFWGLIRVMIFTAFYETAKCAGAPGASAMTLPEIISYIWLGQAFFALLPWNLDAELRELIRSGNVAYELVRPVDLHLFWLMRSLAQRTAPVLLRSVPMLIAAGLFLGLLPPASIGSALAFLLTIALAALLAATITTCLTVSLLWTISGEGLNRFVPPFVAIFSGNVIPLPLMPESLKGLLHFLPFRGLFDVPAGFYLGRIPLERLPIEAGFQLVWIVALNLVARAWLRAGTRRLIVQGG